MSMKTDIDYGYGFYTWISDEELADFILNHEKTVLELGEYAKELVTWIKDKKAANEPLDALKEDFFDIESDWGSDDGAYSVVADVMTLETGISFIYRSDCECNEYDAIFFKEQLPWNYSEKEKNLTLDKLEEIVNKYAKELNCRPDFVRFITFG